MREVAPEETMATIAIAARYEETGELLGWTVPRVKRLCRMWHATPAELFHSIGELDFKKIRRYMIGQAKLPSTVRKQLFEMERDIVQRVSGLKGKVAA